MLRCLITARSARCLNASSLFAAPRGRMVDSKACGEEEES